jgi:hypothetical protein
MHTNSVRDVFKASGFHASGVEEIVIARARRSRLVGTIEAKWLDRKSVAQNDELCLGA